MKRFWWILLLSVLISCLSGEMVFTDTENFTLDTHDPVTNIIAPAGGENWFIGDSELILWSAEDSNLSSTPITIRYFSSNNPAHLTVIEDYENTGTYGWEIPPTPGQNVFILIEARDVFGNRSEAISAESFSLIPVPPASPENFQIDISNGLDALISWEPVTVTINGTPIDPDGYIILYSGIPYEDDRLYYYLENVTEGTSFLHQGVVSSQDQMFYRVLAYKDYTGVWRDTLSRLSSQRGAKLTWKELLRQISAKGNRR